VSLRSPPAPELRLHASIMREDELDPQSRDAMWALFSTYYADVTREHFERDLGEKDHVIVLRCNGDQSLQGFSTITTFKRKVQGKRVVGVFSGDTIVAKEFWRQTALHRAFLSYVVRVKLRNPHRPVYWFLISKGFRTYLLMAKNFPEYWPRYDQPTPAWQAAIIDDFSRLRYPDAWKPELGILQFEKPAGRLRQELAPIDDEARKVPEVRFFEERNPRHADGEELCCIGRIDGRLWASYMTKLARRFVGGRNGAK
jgi:hypothetical protein